MNELDDMTRRELSRLPVRVPPPMPTRPYGRPMGYGTIVANAAGPTFSGPIAVGDFAIVNVFDYPSGNFCTLAPSSNTSITNWAGGFGNIDDSPNAPNLTDFTTTSTIGATARFGLTDLASDAQSLDPVIECVISVVARRTAGSMNLQTIQIVNPTNTADLTDPGAMTLSSSWELATFRLSLVGQPTLSDWNAANLKFVADSNAGTIQIAAASVRLKYRMDVTAIPSPSFTQRQVEAYNRMAATTVGKQVYLHEFPWGYEIIRAEA